MHWVVSVASKTICGWASIHKQWSLGRGNSKGKTAITRNVAWLDKVNKQDTRIIPKPFSMLDKKPTNRFQSLMRIRNIKEVSNASDGNSSIFFPNDGGKGCV